MRADAENRIKELKYDFGADSFNIKNFSPSEATMNFVMLAYNLMSLFRQAVLTHIIRKYGGGNNSQLPEALVLLSVQAQ